MSAHTRRWRAGAACLVTLSVSAIVEAQAPPSRTVVVVGQEPNQQDEISSVVIDQMREEGLFQGSTLTAQPRSYYLNRNHEDNQDNLGFALGGALEYRSGWWRDMLRFGGTLYSSQKVHGPADKDGTQLFKPGPESFSVLGEAQMTVRFSETTGLRIGRQRFELPYLGSHDIRMVPNTFQGVAVGNTAPSGFAWIAGYVDKIKRKDDDEFVSMSEAAGAAGTEKGVSMAGARYISADGAQLAMMDQHTSDLFNTLFVKAEKKFPVGNDFRLGADLQYTDQRSVGANLIGDFATSLWAAKFELERGNTTGRIAFSSTSDERGIQKPYGNPANYLSVIVNDFDRAGEDAWLVGVTHDFGKIGNGDLSLFANIVDGDTPDAGANASPDQREHDLTVDYRWHEGPADGLWLRLRAAFVDQDEAAGGDDYLDFRIIINYAFDFL